MATVVRDARTRWARRLLAVSVLVGGLASGALGAADGPAPVGVLRLVRGGAVSLATPCGESAVRLALADLARDFASVLGAAPDVRDGADGTVVVRLDAGLAGPERFRIEVTPARVLITGSDALGAVYGIYRFSEALLGVDPYWFWKDWPPAAREEVAMETQTIESAPVAFRYRGWFVNDEDFLTEWREGGGRRFIDYPFYHQVIHPDVADRLFEALLRAGGNLIIPASFVDVMNEPEAALAARAAARGLYVSQHHVEPLGVSHFGFETYWQKRGEKAAFSYASDAPRVRETWTAYAKRWRDLAGDRVVWQLGLRGRGDRPAWADDRGITEATAGPFISRALRDQWDIVRAVDPRPRPPATVTLWDEGSRLMSRGVLDLPAGVTVVFADEGASQTMQADFRDIPRAPDRTYGVYYHVGFWNRGPHMVQGTRPEKVRRTFDAIVAKGDTHYAVLNVCNVREHLLGIEAAMALLRNPAGFDADRFLDAWAPPPLAAGYREFLAALVDLEGEKVLQDGMAHHAARLLVDLLEKGRREPLPGALVAEVVQRRGRGDRLTEAIARLDGVIAGFRADAAPPQRRGFYVANLLVQARILRGLYAYLRELALALDDPRRLADAEAALEGVIRDRSLAAQGLWENWYRGDRKMNLPALLDRTRALRRRPAPAAGADAPAPANR